MRDSLDRCQAGLAVVVGNSAGDPLPWVTGWMVDCVGNGRTENPINRVKYLRRPKRRCRPRLQIRPTCCYPEVRFSWLGEVSFFRITHLSRLKSRRSHFISTLRDTTRSRFPSFDSLCSGGWTLTLSDTLRPLPCYRFQEHLCPCPLSGDPSYHRSDETTWTTWGDFLVELRRHS